MKTKIALICVIIALLSTTIFTACALIDPYTVIFNVNAPDVEEIKPMSSSDIHKNGLPTPTRDGWIFAGWYMDNQTWEYEYSPDDDSGLKGKIELYARWAKEECTVTFVVYDGKSVQSKSVVTVGGGDVVTPPKVKHTNPTKVFSGWFTDSDCENKWDGEAVYDDITLYAKWYNYYDNPMFVLPKIYIRTKNGVEKIDHGVYTPVSVSMTNSDEDFSNVDAEIKGRGNSTWYSFDKKPYKIKFAKKINLFGMGKRRDWILLANAMDHTLMRNYLAFYIAANLDEPYTSGSQWVHLFINGKYEGVYLLCEQTESGPHRVDIETVHTEDDTDVGFLVEYGGSADVNENKFFKFETVKGNNIHYQMTDHLAVIKYPKGADCTDEQRDYISMYANEVNWAIMKKQWSKITYLVDIDSFVNYFIVEEILLNNDMGWNFFFYKPAGGKLCLGPHWDLDQSAGNSSYGGETYRGWNAGSPHPWFESLVQMDEFIELVRERWLEKYDFIHTIPSFIDEKAAEYQYDIAANFTRWNVLGKSHWRSVPSLDMETTYQGHIDYLKTWLKNRISWIEKEIGVRK